MLSVVARLKIKDGEMDEALKAVKELIPKVATEEGTIFYSLNKDPNNPGLLEQSIDSHLRAGQRSGMRTGCCCTLGCGACLDRYDRLRTCNFSRDLRESARIAEILQIKQDYLDVIFLVSKLIK